MTDFRLYRTSAGPVAERLSGGNAFFSLPDTWDALLARDDLRAYLISKTTGTGTASLQGQALAPVVSQEVWAAGVTYERSRDARLEEAKKGGGGSFYDKVYDAARPELFMKANGWRVRGPGETVRIRRDATWNVPEPEVALCMNPRGDIIGATLGNDMSSRDIEGENPLYLPQAKIYDGACALGPALWIGDITVAHAAWRISIEIVRGGTTMFAGETPFARMRRKPSELAEFLYRETSFPDGAYLLTGTGVVPPDDFTLHIGDHVRISIPAIGTLTNTVDS